MLTTRTMAIVICLGGALASGTLAKDETRLDQLRTIYETSMAKCEEEHRQRIENWPREYTAAVAAAQSRVQKAGDLNGWSATNEELIRFRGDQNITDGDIANAPRMIQQLQQEFKKRREMVDIDRAKKIVDLNEKYIGYLSSLQKSLTQGGEIDQAFAVRSEITRIGASDRVTSAKFSLADHEASNPDPAPVISSPVVSPPPEPHPQPVAVQNDVVVTSSGIRVYPAGDTPPRKSGETYARKSLSRSTHSPIARAVYVSAYEHTQVSTKELGDLHTVTTTDLSVRLTVRAAHQKDSLERARVYVQFFGKDAGSLSARAEPAVGELRAVELPVLDAESIYLDFPAVSQESIRHGRHTRGRKHYGYIVSVFSSEGKLLYQGSSVSGLRSLAVADMPSFSDVDQLEDHGQDRNIRERRRDVPRLLKHSDTPIDAARREFFRALTAHRANPQNAALKVEYREALKKFEILREQAKNE